MEEVRRRRAAVLSCVARLGGDAFVTFGPPSIFYLAQYPFSQSERPTALVVIGDGRAHLLVPRLRLRYAEAVADAHEIRSYPEYPGREHPMAILARWLRDLGVGRSSVVAESAGYSSAQGYSGFSIAALLPDSTVRLESRLVERLRRIKSAEEIAMLREAYRWAAVAHRRLQEGCRVGVREQEITGHASSRAYTEMARELSRHRPNGPIRIFAGFGSGGGEIGPSSATHVRTELDAPLRPGDNLVTFATAQVGGYQSELERTMLVGEPSPTQERFFREMLRLQDAALAMVRPGAACAALDAEMTRLFAERDLSRYWLHHTGHSIGLLPHEAPFLDVGDDSVIEPGMLLTVEPGIYVPELGAFRHSDTVLIGEEGTELLTTYPRDLESLICS